MTDSSFELIVHETYYNTGFFNVPVRCDRLVRSNEGDVVVYLGDSNQRIVAAVNRTANLNKTARIMGGVPLRDWFQNHCKIKDSVIVEFIDRESMRISRQGR